jgi:hypothetical protein
MVTTDADRSFSVFCTQHTPWRHHMIPGYLSREVNARTVLPISDYARGGLTRFEIIVYGTLIRPRSPRGGAEMAGRPALTEMHMDYLRACADDSIKALSGLPLAKIRQCRADAGVEVDANGWARPPAQHRPGPDRLGNKCMPGTAELPSCCRLQPDGSAEVPYWLPPRQSQPWPISAG